MLMMLPSNARKNSAFQHPHETRHHDQLYARLAQRLDERALGGFIQLGPKLARGNITARHASFARACEDAGIGDIAQHHGHLRRNLARAAGVGNGNEVRTFAGTENSDAERRCIHYRTFTGRRGERASFVSVSFARKVFCAALSPSIQSPPLHTHRAGLKSAYGRLRCYRVC